MDESVNFEKSQLAMLSCHLQIGNLVSILRTIDFEVLSRLVKDAPQEVVVTPHFFFLNKVYEMCEKLNQFNEKRQTSDTP